MKFQEQVPLKFKHKINQQFNAKGRTFVLYTCTVTYEHCFCWTVPLIYSKTRASTCFSPVKSRAIAVLDPGKGACADPVKRGAILEGEGPGPPCGDNERQLSPDRGGGKT